MVERNSGRPHKLRYIALPFMRREVACWMVCEAYTGRLVVKPLHMCAAITLAHTLNVADLAEPVRYYGDP